jgi:hypothetical protein
MKVYIVQLNDGLKIFKVQPQDEAEFLEQYKDHIIAAGSSIQDVIMQFAKLVE